MENQTIRIKTFREIYLTNMLNNQTLRAKRYFIEPKDRKLKDREEKIKGDIIMSKDNMEKFEEQEMSKIRSIKRNVFHKLIKQNVTRNKPKLIRDKLKDRIKDRHFLKQNKKKKKERN